MFIVKPAAGGWVIEDTAGKVLSVAITPASVARHLKALVETHEAQQVGSLHQSQPADDFDTND